MEAPFDAEKTKDDMTNFSGSASDMLAAMQAAGISVPDAKEAAERVAAAAPSAPEECNDPSCTHDHDHGHEHSGHVEKEGHHDAHDHGHGHGHGGHAKKEEAEEEVKGSSCCGGHGHDSHEHSHEHSHGHGHTAHPPMPPSSDADAASGAAATAATAATTAAAASEEGGVQLIDATESSLTLAWKPIAKCLKYELEWRPVGEDAEWAKLGSKGFKTALPPKQKNKLASGSTFEFRVRGRDEVDWFSWSEPRTHSTLTASCKRLPAVALNKAEDGALTVTWKAEPEGGAGGAAIAAYELQMRESGDHAWATVSASLKGNAARKRNLKSDGKYSFRVKPSAFETGKGGGDGEWFFSVPNTPEFKPSPPTHPFFSELFGSKLLVPSASGQESCGLERLAGKVVGIYFSASWCGPCRQFTPMLAQIYNQAKAAGRQFEVVFVSADRDAASFDGYYRGHGMPWLAVPFDAAQRQQIQSRFQVNGIPNLKIFNSSGVCVDDNAVQSRNLTVENIAAWEKGLPGTNMMGGGGCGSGGGGCCGGGCH